MWDALLEKWPFIAAVFGGFAWLIRLEGEVKNNQADLEEFKDDVQSDLKEIKDDLKGLTHFLMRGAKGY